MIVNSLVSFAFFAGSLLLGTYNQSFLPFAACVILLWALADASLTNQLLFDRSRSKHLDISKKGVRHTFLVWNLSVAVLCVPLCLVFGLAMAVIVGRWMEVINGLVMALLLIWGWLGICNVMSVRLPFEQMQAKQVMKRQKGWLGYSILYALPWIMLPVYAGIIILPLTLLHWITGQKFTSHMFVSLVLIATVSIVLWLVGLNVVARHAGKPQAKVWKLL